MGVTVAVMTRAVIMMTVWSELDQQEEKWY